MISFFDIENTAFEIFTYKISYIELIGTLFGLISVWFATKANILTWSTGIINEFFFFLLFFQVQLYADMVLQVYFFIVTIYGWYYWKSKDGINQISTIKNKHIFLIIVFIIFGSYLFGSFLSNIHLFFRDFFTVKAAYPFIDSFIMVSSIIATILLAKKKIENWYLWIIIDLVCVVLYFSKGVLFLSLEYLVFLGLAIYGLISWKKEFKNG